MKLLSILRHAKSSWKDAELDDHDRPLNRRGSRDAPRVGRLLREHGLLPEVILCSTARRARETAGHVSREAGFPGEVRFSRRLYLARPDAYLEVLALLPDDVGHALVIGHNPGLEELLEALVGEPHTLPTAALALVELPLDAWSRLPGAEGRLRQLWRPKEPR
jgi:phosphohistidine phosphatase